MQTVAIMHLVNGKPTILHLTSVQDSSDDLKEARTEYEDAYTETFDETGLAAQYRREFVEKGAVNVSQLKHNLTRKLRQTYVISESHSTGARLPNLPTGSLTVVCMGQVVATADRYFSALAMVKRDDALIDELADIVKEVTASLNKYQPIGVLHVGPNLRVTLGDEDRRSIGLLDGCRMFNHNGFIAIEHQSKFGAFLFHTD